MSDHTLRHIDQLTHPEGYWRSCSHGWSCRLRLSVPKKGARAAMATRTAITRKKVMADILRQFSSCH